MYLIYVFHRKNLYIYIYLLNTCAYSLTPLQTYILPNIDTPTHIKHAHTQRWIDT